MLQLSSLASLSSREHSMEMSDWSCGKWEEPVESRNGGDRLKDFPGFFQTLTISLEKRRLEEVEM